MTKYLVVVEVDTDDADYVSKATVVSLEELQRLESIVEKLKIKAKKNRREGVTPLYIRGIVWSSGEFAREKYLPSKLYGDILTPEDEELFYNLTTTLTFHTIESIMIYEITRDPLKLI